MNFVRANKKPATIIIFTILLAAGMTLYGLTTSASVSRLSHKPPQVNSAQIRNTTPESEEDEFAPPGSGEPIPPPAEIENERLPTEDGVLPPGSEPVSSFGKDWERIDIEQHVPKLLKTGKALRHGVVQLGFPEATTTKEFESTGSGFLIHESGILLSNAHVVEGFESMSVRTYKGKLVHADVVAQTKTRGLKDIAILKIRGNLPKVKVLEFASLDSLEPRDVVFNIGHPAIFGDWVIKAGGYMGVYFKNMTLDMPGGVGDSGSPLFNMDGKIVGIIFGATNLESMPGIKPEDETVVWWGNFIHYHRAVGRANNNHAIKEFLSGHLSNAKMKDIFGARE